MPRVLRPVGHEDRLSVVDHLDELRSRLIICVAALLVAFGVCFWQNHLLLHALNNRLPPASSQSSDHIASLGKDLVRARPHLLAAGGLYRELSLSSDQSLQDRGIYAALSSQMIAAARALPRRVPENVPITIGVGEPFTTTLTVCFYFAVLLTLPLLLYEAYAFVIPALNPEEKRVAVPIMIAAPVLFVIGVVFTYVVVLPPAVRFLQGYNSQQFQALVQAKPLYAFEVMTMAAVGLAFELPLLLLGLQRLGVINGSTLTRHWRYGVLIIAVIAAAMPGADPVTTGLETLPLVILFVASIVMLKFADRRDAKRALAELTRIDLPDGDRDPDEP